MSPVTFESIRLPKTTCLLLRRYHHAFSLYSHLFLAVYMLVHVVGLPPSHQPPGIQRAVCDVELLHVWPHGLFVPVPERVGPGTVPAPLSVG